MNDSRISKHWLAAVLCLMVMFACGPVVFGPSHDGQWLSHVRAADEDVPAEATAETESTAAASAAEEPTPEEKPEEAKTGAAEDAADRPAKKKTDDELTDADLLAAEPAAGEKSDGGKSPRSKESFLVWLYKSLGARYVTIFLIITFNAVALIAMIALGVRRNVLCPDDLIFDFDEKLNQKKYQEAYDLVKNDRSLLGRILAAGMARVPDGYEHAVEAMQEVGESQNMRLEQRNGYIALIAQVAPMFGLLGTVDGMVMAFDVISHSNVTPKPSELAQGIGTALVTTVVGLWISIPCLVFYSIIRNRLARLILETGAVSGNLMKRFASAKVAINKS